MGLQWLHSDAERQKFFIPASCEGRMHGCLATIHAKVPAHLAGIGLPSCCMPSPQHAAQQKTHEWGSFAASDLL